MQKKKENLLGRIVKKDYKNKLEEVLEHKNFSEQTKSLLLSMLYKIENAYSDYSKVKQSVESKDEYIESIISIIKNKCNNIEVISSRSQRSEELGRRIFVIDDKTKSIKCYPVERKLLYAISKIAKKDLIIDKEKYGIIAKPLSDLINIGNNINTVEPLRDFNGYSWTTLNREIESLEYNLIYQNLRILLGYKLLKDWTENEDNSVDYMAFFEKTIKDIYGESNKKIIKELINKLAILLEIKLNEKEKKEILDIRSEILEQTQYIDDNKLFTEYIYNQKKEISEKIKKIDTIINNPYLLQEEAEARNIYNLNDLAEELTRKREREFINIENLNKLLIPKNFVKYKKQIETKRAYLEILKTENFDEEINRFMIELQTIFLKCFEIRIEQARTKLDVTKLLYEFRYFYLLPFNKEKSIYEVDELKIQIEKTIRILIDRMKLEGIIGEFSKRKDLETKIIRSILTLKTIRLEDIYVMVSKDKEKNLIYLTIFDESEFEQKIELGSVEEIQKKDLGIKLNKKVRVFY